VYALDTLHTVVMTAICGKSEELMQWLAAEFSENVFESLKGQSITSITF